MAAPAGAEGAADPPDFDLFGGQQRRTRHANLQARIQGTRAQMQDRVQQAQQAATQAQQAQEALAAQQENMQVIIDEARSEVGKSRSQAEVAERRTRVKISTEKFAEMWMMGSHTERTVGRPREWNGSDEGFEDFQHKLNNYMSSTPGADRERTVMALLDGAAAAAEPISFAEMDDRERTVAVGINQMLTSLCSGRALNIIKRNKDPQAAWRCGGCSVPSAALGAETATRTCWRRSWTAVRAVARPSAHGAPSGWRCFARRTLPGPSRLTITSSAHVRGEPHRES